MVYEILDKGASNARSGRELCTILHCSPRDLTAAITRERRAGKPICASTQKTKGYFIPATQDEMQAYCQSLRHRAGEIFATRRACLKMLDSLPAGEQKPQEAQQDD